MKKYILFFIVYLLFGSGYAQNFEKFIGGSREDNMYAAQQTTDGGYICTGLSGSNDGDLSGTGCTVDESVKTWIVKLSQTGNIQWQKCLGTQMFSSLVQQTIDGGYIVAGGGGAGLPGNNGAMDFHIVKLDYTGNIQWQKLFGSSESEAVYSIQQTKDGGYILAGETEGNDGDVAGNHGFWDFWIVKLSNTGNIQWKKCFGGTSYERANSVQQTTDGGYIIAGVSGSNDGDVSGNHGSGDMWIVKLNKRGNIQWQKSLGGSGGEEATSIQQIHGGYIIAGYSASNNGDVSGNHGNGDIWIVKLSHAGHIQWQKCLGNTHVEYARTIRQTVDGGYVVASNVWDYISNIPSDLWVVQLSKSGIVQQQQTFGTPNADDWMNSMEITSDGGFIIAGFSYSTYENGTGTHGQSDGWILKLGAIGARLNTTKSISEKSISDNSISIYPNPASNEIQVNTTENMRDLPYKIYDQSGKSVLKGKLNENETTITISSLSKGIYILNIGDNNKINRKIIKD